MIKVFVQKTETKLVALLNKLAYQVELYPETIRFRDLEGKLNHGDIVFWNQIPMHGFYASRANVILMTDSTTEHEEYAAAKAGALAYISDSLPEEVLEKVIMSVAKGELWMTRNTIAKLFDACVKAADQESC